MSSFQLLGNKKRRWWHWAKTRVLVRRRWGDYLSGYYTNTVRLGLSTIPEPRPAVWGSWESISHCYPTVASRFCARIKCMTRGIQHLSRETCCVDAEEVRWLSSDITPIQFGWVSTMDSWTLINTSRLLGVNLALLSHSDLHGCGVTLING